MSCPPAPGPSARGLFLGLGPAPRVLLFFALIFITVSIPNQAWSAFAGQAFLVMGLALLSRPAWLRLARQVLSALGLAAFVALSILLSPQAGAWERFLSALCRAGLALVLLALLGQTTPFPQLLAGMRGLKVPGLFLDLTAMTWRFGFLLSEQAGAMLRALRCRGWRGRWLWQARTLGHLLGGLFLRSLERAERVHQAMLCRGLDPFGPGILGQTAGAWVSRGSALALALLFLALSLVLRFHPHG